MERELDLSSSPEEALAAVARTAEDWGAVWAPGAGGGRLELPVVAGLRRGVVAGRIEARSTAAGAQLTLRVETAIWRIHRSAVAVLVLGVIGALPVILWPLRDELLALAPPGLVLMLVAWFLVASRLRTAGADEFLEAVRYRLEASGTAG